MKYRELIRELQRREDDMTPTKSQARGVRRAPDRQPDPLQDAKCHDVVAAIREINHV